LQSITTSLRTFDDSPLPFRDLVILLEGVMILQGCLKLYKREGCGRRRNTANYTSDTKHSHPQLLSAPKAA
ncbi:MAG TPA: hypothetical protein DDY45_12135, partial [Verrucomicrobiales bacterium]|nr:hypothetical protein [Verrucomicrobiales bacterium]